MKIASAFTFHLNHAIEEGLVCVGKCESMCRRTGLVLKKSIARFLYVETGNTLQCSATLFAGLDVVVRVRGLCTEFWDENVLDDVETQHKRTMWNHGNCSSYPT